MGTWLLTNPVSTVGGYDNLGKIASSGDNIENIETVQNQLTDGKCLSMNKLLDSPHKFKINVISCYERKRTICRIDAPSVAAPSKPPQFPCLKKSQKTRRKRESEKLINENSA